MCACRNQCASRIPWSSYLFRESILVPLLVIVQCSSSLSRCYEILFPIWWASPFPVRFVTNSLRTHTYTHTHTRRHTFSPSRVNVEIFSFAFSSQSSWSLVTVHLTTQFRRHLHLSFFILSTRCFIFIGRNNISLSMKYINTMSTSVSYILVRNRTLSRMLTTGSWMRVAYVTINGLRHLRPSVAVVREKKDKTEIKGCAKRIFHCPA